MFAIAYLILVTLMFFIIRGRGIRPNTPSIAYWSKEQVLNHAALNPMYNLIYSLGVKDEYKNMFKSMSEQECEEVLADMHKFRIKNSELRIKTSRPNIVLIIWESLSARFFEEGDVLPNLKRLGEEGVMFTHCDCSSFRTDRGLPAIICGLPGQPTASIIRHTRKLPKLPSFVKTLRDAGYDTTAVHGGDCFIMHKREFYLATGHDRVIEQRDLNDTQTCKWGVHDGPMFEHLKQLVLDKSQGSKPFELTFQTLSSHEPFVVPFKRLENEVHNAFAYTDEFFGRFVEELKTTRAWDNLLIIVTGDHGLNDGVTKLPKQDYAHIPLVMLGGAISEAKKIDTICNQTDIAATVLEAMNLAHEEFPFSVAGGAGYSLHTYNNGFVFRDETGYTHYDNVGQQVIEGEDVTRERKGKAMLQKIYEYIYKL